MKGLGFEFVEFSGQRFRDWGSGLQDSKVSGVGGKLGFMVEGSRVLGGV